MLNQPYWEFEEAESHKIDWYVDPCWEAVFRHDASGKALFGSKYSLTEGLESGKRVKLRVGDKFYEASEVVITLFKFSTTTNNNNKKRNLFANNTFPVIRYVLFTKKPVKILYFQDLADFMKSSPCSWQTFITFIRTARRCFILSSKF